MRGESGSRMDARDKRAARIQRRMWLPGVALMAAVFSLAPAPSRADPVTDRYGPDTFVSIGPMQLQAGDHLVLDCDTWRGWNGQGDPPRSYDTDFFGYTERRANGEEAGLIFVAAKGNDGTSVRIGEVSATVLPESGRGWWSGIRPEVSPTEAVEIRMVLAFWGTEVPCSLTLNGEPETYQLLPRSAGLFLDESTFPGLASASVGEHFNAGVVWGRGGTNAGAGLSYSHRTDGYVFTGLIAKGLAAISGPDGESAGPISSPGIGFIGESHGEWRYDVTAAEGVGLYILQTPV